MKIINSIEDLNKIKSLKVGVTIGNFDGLHEGHSFLLNNIKKDCLTKNRSILVITFSPHPSLVINPKDNYLLSTSRQKKELLENIGVDYLWEVSFNRDFSTLSPEVFFQEYLKKIKVIECIYLGYDFSFGKNKTGSMETINELYSGSEVEIYQQKKFIISDEVVSSSLIRSLLWEGKIEKANEMIGRDYSIIGTVVKGKGRGRTIGFPTANIKSNKENLTPTRGVYASRIRIDDEIYLSMTNIGLNPTFDDNRETFSVESNIFDFSKDIYGKKIELYFTKKIRDEIKFSSVEELGKQLKSDKNRIKDIFSDALIKKRKCQ